MEKIFPLFSSKSADYRFLTFRGTESKHQKIGFVNDLCKKISETYFIVRERNKKTEGYHFHALMKLSVEPKKTWFKKGCHMHLQKVGKPENVNPVVSDDMSMNDREIMEMYQHLPIEEAQANHLLIIRDRALKSAKKSIKHDRNVVSIMNYMFKELEMPCQFTDYILFGAGKHVTL